MAFRFAEAYVQFSQRGLTGVSGSISRITRGFSGAIGMAGRFAMALGVGGGGLGLAGAIRVAATFEQTMSSVQAKLSATTSVAADEMSALEAIARDLGATTSFSASQAAEAEMYLAQAGFNSQQIIGALPGVLSLAQAGHLDLGSAADIASNALTGFGIEAEESNRVADVLAVAASSANTDVRQLGDGLKYVAPVAAGLNVEIEEATAAIGALSDAGLQGEMAGTGLRKILATLAAPSDNLTKRMNGLKLETDGLIAVLEQIGPLTVAETFEEFGQRGGPAFSILSDATPKVEGLTKALEESQGAASRIAEIMTDNLVGDSKEAVSALQELILVGGSGGAVSSMRGTLAEITAFFRSDIARSGVIAAGNAVSEFFRNFTAGAQAVVMHTDDIVRGFDAFWTSSELVFNAGQSVVTSLDDIWSSLADGSDAFDEINGKPSEFADEVEDAADRGSAAQSDWLDDMKFWSRNFGDLWKLATVTMGIHLANATAMLDAWVKRVNEKHQTLGKNIGEWYNDFTQNRPERVRVSDRITALDDDQRKLEQQSDLAKEIYDQQIALVRQLRAEGADPIEIFNAEASMREAGTRLAETAAGIMAIEEQKDRLRGDLAGLQPQYSTPENPQPEMLRPEDAPEYQAILEKMAQAETAFGEAQRKRETEREAERRKRDAERMQREAERQAQQEQNANREADAEERRQKRLWDIEKNGQANKTQAAEDGERDRQRVQVHGAEELWRSQLESARREAELSQQTAMTDRPVATRERGSEAVATRQQERQKKLDERSEARARLRQQRERLAASDGSLFRDSRFSRQLDRDSKLRNRALDGESRREQAASERRFTEQRKLREKQARQRFQDRGEMIQGLNRQMEGRGPASMEQLETATKESNGLLQEINSKLSKKAIVEARLS